MRAILPPGATWLASAVLFLFAGAAFTANYVISSDSPARAETGPVSPAPAYSTPLPSPALPTTPAAKPTTIPTHVITSVVVKYVFVTPPPARTHPSKKPTTAPTTVPPTPSSSSSTPSEQPSSTPSSTTSSP